MDRVVLLGPLKSKVIMEKQKRWQLYLILAVILLTVYNILPTIFYYSKPLKKPINSKDATQIATDIVNRVNDLESFTVAWLRAQSKNLGLKPLAINIDPQDPRLASVTFTSAKDATSFAQTLYRAGSLIPFIPAQLTPDPRSFEPDATRVIVQRKIGIHLDKNHLNTYFHFVPKVTDTGSVSPTYQQIVNDRVIQLALGFAGQSRAGTVLKAIATGSASDDAIFQLARNIVEYENAFSDHHPITQRYFASFSSVAGVDDKERLIQTFISKLDSLAQKMGQDISTIREEQSQLQHEGKFLTSTQQQKLEVLESQKNLLSSAAAIVKRNIAVFAQGKPPLTQDNLMTTLGRASVPASKVQTLELGSRNPFVSSLTINWNKDLIQLNLQPDVAAVRTQNTTTEAKAIQVEKLNQFLFNEIAAVSRLSDESITPSLTSFAVSLNRLTNSTSLLTLDLAAITTVQSTQLEQLLTNSWQPKDGELSHTNYPIYNWDQFAQLAAKQQKLGLVIYAPAMEKTTEEGFRKGSIYVIARGLNTIRQKYQDLPDSSEKRAFEKDFQSLMDLMKQSGFIGYAATSSDLPTQYQQDYIFEWDDYFSYLLAASREDFWVKGSKKLAILELTNVAQRLLTLNKIDTQMHEDLLKWRDEYRSARVNVNPQARYDVPPPIHSVLWDNIRLSTVKYFRGDERKIIKWGLDLSGGKTVRVGLKDQNNQPITEEDDLKQAVNELYQRVNRLGVSEVGIRTEGSTIVLDFPGSQGFSAADLIQASAMYFHVVNEKFSPQNPLLREAVNIFLEEVWNEAIITNRTDPESLNEIAWLHLGGNRDHPGEFRPLSGHARLLYDNGLRFAGPHAPARSSAFDDTLSAISTFRGSDFTDWQGQTYPLLIVFRNYALEGANLTDVQTGYDPSEGNILHFSVKSSSISRAGEKSSPRDDFYAWTSQFSEEKIVHTPLEAYSQGRGWRMAVILNGTVISSPTLNSPLRDSTRISGHFSQREINQLAADLKAGSLSFTPHILSEENVSPDLGQEQRSQGIFAAALGLGLVILIMCAYYRFSGVVASVAVLFNLLIIWGVLQNLGAALTLPGIAGIILAVGMSVDANVLVFERIREELAISKRLPAAIQAGYRKAFSAILDSNLTTILAAVILLNFDSGPIKGFALTLIIGIISSMFTSLFMTRFFFAGWVQDPAHKALKMHRLFQSTHFDFLSQAKLALSASIILILLGGFFLVQGRHTIFGMDFTGGYALTIDLQEKSHPAYRFAAEEGLIKAGAAKSDFRIQELNKPNQLRIQLGTSMEHPGKPFAGMDSRNEGQTSPLFPYQANPRIVWIVNALERASLELNPASLPTLNLHWTEMSGQLSETMRNHALFGLILALFCILIYITFRFEFKYAISATVGLVHDILITMGILAITHFFVESVQIDLQVIAALMTIVGYSLNDTIIIFDRIREDIHILRKMSFKEVINHALNATLSRTVMTSGTTLVVLLALVLFGGASIFSFAFIMAIGVGIGTFSSLFVAAPLLLYFHKREMTKSQVSTSIKSL
jgi:SecD/SecF fusion protein